MFSFRANRNMLLASPVAALAILAASALEARAQRPGTPSNPARDMVRAISRQEMDQLLLRKPIPALNSNDPGRRLLRKQISDDFRELQNLNNRMMSETWASQVINYGFVSNMISQIRDKANRLKLNLSLPDADAGSARHPDPTNDKEFRAVLITLDRTIMRFVKNPVFQNPNAIEVTLAKHARQDLENVIELAANLRRIALKLGKAGTR